MNYIRPPVERITLPADQKQLIQLTEMINKLVLANKTGEGSVDLKYDVLLSSWTVQTDGAKWAVLASELVKLERCDLCHKDKSEKQILNITDSRSICRKCVNEANKLLQGAKDATKEKTKDQTESSQSKPEKRKKERQKNKSETSEDESL